MNSFVASIHYLQIASALGKKNCEAPSRVSIYTAELYALTLALGLVRKLRNSQSFTLTLSVLCKLLARSDNAQ